ncbi:MAG: orotidine-5'-phosphate decarboxylase [Planctomycetes bacterium]|nr:orotidine-5'-phosphate decarboxylase [Planctomycetota bacterium]
MNPVTPFPTRLAQRVRQCRNPVVVGLDPRWEQLPPAVAAELKADTLADRAGVFLSFCREVIDVVADLAPAVKPQAAFFEQLGSAGMVALEQTIAYARQKGLIVILDGKRNDIGSTAEAYAQAYLGADSPWRSDALTVSPYLGGDSLEPFCQVAGERGAGLFVLVKTSNPGGGHFQDLVANGRPLYRHVAEHVEQLSKAAAVDGYGPTGAVVGATYPAQLGELRAAMPSAWILVPGYGSQGGTAKDVAPAFDERGLGALVNNSRGIIFAHAKKEFARFAPADWQRAVEAATRDMIEQLRAETTAGRL